MKNTIKKTILPFNRLLFLLKKKEIESITFQLYTEKIK